MNLNPINLSDPIEIASKAPGPLIKITGTITGLLPVDIDAQLTRALSTEASDVAIGGID